MEKIFESLIEAVPVIKEIVQEDCAIILADREKFLIVEEGKYIKLPMKTGMNTGITPTTEKVFNEKKTDYSILHIKEYDTYSRSATIPILDRNENVIGVLSFIRDATEEEKNKKISGVLIEDINDVEDAVKMILESAKKISDSLSEIIKISQNSYNDIEKSNEAVKLIETTSKKTNILGINANIESARAGEAGKGFNVVAKEMMKLASQSSGMSKEISDSLVRMKSNIEITMGEMTNFQEIVKAQENATKEITIAIENISQISKKLIQNK